MRHALALELAQQLRPAPASRGSASRPRARRAAAAPGRRASARAISTMRCLPSGRLPAARQCARQADARDLPRRLGEGARLLGAIEPQHRRAATPRAAAQVGAERHVVEHRHLRRAAYVLERARQAERARSRGRQAADRVADETGPRPRVSGSAPEIRSNMVLLPAPFGPISPRISPARISKLTSFTATRPPNCLRAGCTASSTCARRRPAARAAAARRRPGDRRRGAAQRLDRRVDRRPQAVARVLQQQHASARRTRPARSCRCVPSSCGSKSCSTCLHQRDQRRAERPRPTRCPRRRPPP